MGTANMDHYVELCQSIGRDNISACGFITPRAIENSTFIYGDISASIIPALTSESIVFYRYDKTSKSYLKEESETIRLHHPAKKGSKIVHFDNQIEDKNLFSVSFALIREDQGKVRIDIVKKSESFNVLRDLGTAIRKMPGQGAVYTYALKREFEQPSASSTISHQTFRLNIPYQKDFKIYGGNGTVVLYNKRGKKAHLFKIEKSVSVTKNYNLDLASTTPVFEITGRGVFAVIDGQQILLVDGGVTRINMSDFGMKPSNILYELVRLREGDGANILVYSDGSADALLVMADPSEDDFGKACRFKL